jgi:hypothetical protein
MFSGIINHLPAIHIPSVSPGLNVKANYIFLLVPTCRFPTPVSPLETIFIIGCAAADTAKVNVKRVVNSFILVACLS